MNFSPGEMVRAWDDFDCAITRDPGIRIENPTIAIMKAHELALVICRADTPNAHRDVLILTSGGALGWIYVGCIRHT